MTTTYDEYNILIPIDVLLETHMGTAALLDPKAPLDIINNGYFDRNHNDLWEFTDKFTEEEFLNQWNDRNIDTLKCSVVRNIVEYMQKMIQTKTIENLDRGGNINITVYVNTYPYDVIDYMKGFLCSVISSVFSKIVDVKLVDLTYDEITLNYLISNNIYVMTFNHLDDWFYLHYEDIVKNPKPTIELYIPMICKDLEQKIEKALETNEIDIEFLKQMSPYRACEFYFSDYISLNFLPLEFFSIPQI